VFSGDHLALNLLRLRAKEEWESPGKGMSFLFPKEGLGAYLVGPQAHVLHPGDVLVVNGDPKGRVGVRDGGEVALWLFSVSFEHMYPLFASRELGLLAGVAENLKRTRLYAASTPVAKECHKLLGNAPPRLDFDHRTHLLRVAATILSSEIKAARERRGEYIGADQHITEVLERLSASELLSLSVEELARKFGFCRRHLNRLFHQQFGWSVSRLRMEMRMLKALTLLRDPNAKVINVAEECGFNHLGLFNASFKHRFGTSPGQWRNQSKGTEPGLANSGANRPLCVLRTAGFCPMRDDGDLNVGKLTYATAKGNGGSGFSLASNRTAPEALRTGRTRHPV
jgi:AraC-like DNA-binding protein